MKKLLRLSLLSATLLSIGISVAQIDGTTNIAPNIQEYDINGNYHDMYADYLDNNIPVILDVSAHWCGPCWSYHNTHALEDAMNEYGPNGTVEPNKLMVFWADGDNASTFNLLYGGSGSQGNWVYQVDNGDTTWTPFPIFGGESGSGANAGYRIGNDYEITYFPTIFIIHPDRTVEELSQPSKNTILSAVNNANMLSGNTNDLNLMYAYPMSSACPGGNLYFDYIIKNQGDTTMTTAEIDIKIDDETVSTISWTGSLDAYELSEESFSFDLPTDIETGDHNLQLVVSTVNGVADEDASNNILEKEFDLQDTEEMTYTLTVKTTSAANEINWIIRDANNDIVYQRSDFTGSDRYSNNQTYEHELNLKDPSCYKLIALDAGGDGMAGGYFWLKDYSSKTITYFTISDDEEDFSWQSKVTSAVSSIENGYVETYPNPVQDKLVVNYNVGSQVEVKYSLVDILGKTIISQDLGAQVGKNTFLINTKDLNEGVYILSLELGDEVVTERIVK